MTPPVTRVEDDAVRLLCQELKHLHVQIGEPQFLALQDLSQQMRAAGSPIRFLSKSVINDTVRGKRRTLPDWEWVRSFVTVCRAHAERTQSPIVHKLAGEEYWHGRWYKAKRASMPTAPWPTSGDGTRLDDDVSTDSQQFSRSPADPATGIAGSATLRPLARLTESLTASRYRPMFGQHAVDLLKAAEGERGEHDAEACCRLGLLLVCVGCVDEGTFWLSVAAHEAQDPVAVAVLNLADDAGKSSGVHQLEFAAECLYDMAVGEGYRRMRTRDKSPAEWIDLYLEVAARGAEHKDAAYRLGIRHRAHGRDDEAAYWFRKAARNGHRAAAARLETINQEIMNRWLQRPDTSGGPQTISDT